MKINHLLADWPSGVVATQAWLHQHGVGSSLARKYQQSGWLERVGHGAWQRCGDSIDWQAALALQGYSHYLPLGREVVSFFA